MTHHKDLRLWMKWVCVGPVTGESWWVTRWVCWCILADTVALAGKSVHVHACLWQVVNYTNVFVRSYMFPHAHADHRPDSQVLISCHGYRWCVLTVTVVMTESPASEQRGMLGLTQGPLSHHAVCVYTLSMCVCVCKSSRLKKISQAVTSLLDSQSIS